MKWLLPSVLAAALLVYLARPVDQVEQGADGGTDDSSTWADAAPDARVADADLPPTDDTQQTPTILESAIVAITPSTYLAAPVSADQAEANCRAFRDMLAVSEGTAGPDGYRMMFGQRLFDSFADHPRQYFPFRDKNGVLHTTSAAGRYQFLALTWDECRAALQLPDFGPDSQDAACMLLVSRRGALQDVRAGRFAIAVDKCAKTWASLPGAGYAQHENKLAYLAAAYRAAGGTLEA